MSVIKVWADGQWSNPICGLDKVHLIKNAILYQYAPKEDWDNPDDYEDSLDGFEINGQPISAHFFRRIIIRMNNGTCFGDLSRSV